jgi:predicted site-specific integrase-resolvase
MKRYLLGLVFLALAIGVPLAINAYNDSQTTTSSASFDALAKVQESDYVTLGQGKMAHVFKLATYNGDKIIVSGKDADDMEKQEVGITGKARIHVLYVRVSAYNRRGQLKEQSNYLAQWRWPTRFELDQAY